MEKRNSLPVLSIITVITLLIVASGSLVTATPSAQATQAATAVGTASAATDIPGIGKITGPAEGEAKALNGAGATFPVPLYTKWFSEYEKLTGVKVNYQGVGSGGGIKGISDQTVD